MVRIGYKGKSLLSHDLFCAILFLFFVLIRSDAAFANNSNGNNGKGWNVIVVGGSSGMGKATAMEVVRNGGNVLIVSRSAEKLERAVKEIRDNTDMSSQQEKQQVSTAILDITKESSVEKFAQELKKNSDGGCGCGWDGLVVSAAGKAPHGSITKLDTSETRNLMETKFWGAYHCAKYISPLLRDGGAITFVGGVLNRRPGLNCSPLASTNGALEGLTRSLALDLGPKIRVNCLSPGFCNTERFDHFEESKKQAMFQNTADSLPLQRIGQPSDMGKAIYYLQTAKFCTGVILDCDGGHHIRQYANPTTDPMRQPTN